jgi:GT2 family glycosyltransferase
MRTAVVIPSLGAPSLGACLEAVRGLDSPPAETLVVSSGTQEISDVGPDVNVLRFDHRLGFAEAVNKGITEVWDRVDAVALINDDAFVSPQWLDRLAGFFDVDPRLAAAQGTIRNAEGDRVDGRGVEISRWGLAFQADRGTAARPEPDRPIPRIAVSATAALYRCEALREIALDSKSIFDPRFDSYHEDVDLGLRLTRLGWRSCWFPGAGCRHLGSSSGTRMSWRHPWWLLANPWRVVSGNLGRWATLKSIPRTTWGEVRAIVRMTPDNPRAVAAAGAVAFALPILILQGWRRPTPGPRLNRLPESSS